MRSSDTRICHYWHLKLHDKTHLENKTEMQICHHVEVEVEWKKTEKTAFNCHFVHMFNQMNAKRLSYDIIKCEWRKQQKIIKEIPLATSPRVSIWGVKFSLSLVKD